MPIFAIAKTRQGEAAKRLTIFAEFCVKQNETRGSREEAKANSLPKKLLPLDCLKFLIEIFNQKWAAHNMLRPLIFGNFYRNIQKIKNVLRIICYAPLFEKFLQGNFSNKKEKQAFLHQSAAQPPSPRGEGSERG